MARQIVPQSRFAGLSYSDKEGSRSSFLMAKNVDYRSDPTKIKLLPRTTKISGSVVEDLILDHAREGTDTYLYGDSGNIYKRTSADVVSFLNQATDSHGNGMDYFGEDLFMYYTTDTTIGRYGPFGVGGGTKTFVDDFLGAQGGIPLNTHSLSLNGTTQYATAADSASLSQTGDISIESYFNLTALPAVGESQVFVSKWNEDGNLRSYRFEIYGISGYFGDASDGALTISANTTDAPIDSACTGTAAAYTMTATNASFTTGQQLLIIQSQGTGAGKWERNQIAGYTAGTITVATALTNTYTTGAQVLVLKEYSGITVNSGITWTAKAWNGTVGGILGYLCNGTFTVNGTVSAKGKGFRGGPRGTTDDNGQNGEGKTAYPDTRENGAGWDGSAVGGGGGGGATRGIGGWNGDNPDYSQNWGYPIGSTTDLTTMLFGGGGGGGTSNSNSSSDGAVGGGIIFIASTTITIAGSVTVAGNDSGGGVERSGGGGGGGSCMLKAQVATLGSGLISATGGVSGLANTRGGAGGDGRVHLDYYTSYTGTTSPTINATQDQTLVTNVSYQLRLGISSNGTNEEFLAHTLSLTPVTSQWYRWAVTWDASASQAYFYRNGSLLGRSTGSLTAIYDSTALLAIGASFNSAGTAVNFAGGKTDDVRLWSDIRIQNELFVNNDVEISASAPNLVAYWQVDNSETDTTANANTLTLVNTPTYSTEVPFASPTARLDLDKSLDTSGQTETLPIDIDEGATNRQSFIPAKDPQKSVEVNINTVGTGNWTMTVHDALNRTVAAVTVANAQLHTGDFEFTFADEWRPVLGATYHFHITSTVADGVVVTTTLNDLETADFHTYYQFLVDDENHPIEGQLNFEAIGNERYLATWDGITYKPHRLTFPSGYHVKCLGKWREYIVIGMIQGSGITEYDQGKLFFWDGTADTYNFYRDVPQGGINSILSGDPMYFMAGYSGDFMKFDGGQPRKIRRLPSIKLTDTLEFNRNALSMYRALVHIGMAKTTSTTIEKGVLSYGTLHEELPESLSFDYTTSLGITTGTGLEIGAVFSVGSNLMISWRNGTSYGLDKVAPSNAPYASGTVEFLITDADKIWAEKQAHTIRGRFKALVSGDSFKAKYKIDREDSWEEGSLITTALAKETRLVIPTKSNRFDDFQVAIDIATSNTTSPEFYGWGLEYDDLNRERRT